MESKKRILIADAGLWFFRDALIEALSEEGDMEVVGTTDDGERAVELVRSCKPDILVMDLILSHGWSDVLAAPMPPDVPCDGVPALARGGTTPRLSLCPGAHCSMKLRSFSLCRGAHPLNHHETSSIASPARPHQELTTSIIHRDQRSHIKGYQYLRRGHHRGGGGGRHQCRHQISIHWPSASIPPHPGWSAPSVTPSGRPRTAAIWDPPQCFSCTVSSTRGKPRILVVHYCVFDRLNQRKESNSNYKFSRRARPARL